MQPTYEHHFIATNGITLHVVQAGPPAGPVVILLHGFPEFWQGWRYQIDALAAAGYRVWAPDQRGYNLSDRPAGTNAYNLDILAADIAGLIDATGRDKVYLVGHDWGANVAWWVALQYPDRLHKLAILNVPHPSVMRRHLRESTTQRRRSWYIFFFQLPWLPEAATRAGNWRAGVQALADSSRPGTFSPADVDLYRRVWSRPGAMRGMINWYRAILQQPAARLDSYRVTVPTLLIWGKQDKFLEYQMAQPSIDLCDDGRLVMIDTATHWVQHEEPGRVNLLLTDFFHGLPIPLS